MKKLIACLVLTSILQGCASFKTQMATLQDKKQAAISEIQRQRALRQTIANDSHTRWLSTLSPQQLAAYRTAVTKRETAERKQSDKVMEGTLNFLQRMLEQ